MKKNLLKGLIVATAVGCAAGYAEAQETVAVVEETAVIAVIAEMPCKTHYYTTKRDNWFIQVGAGINSPFVEFYKPNGDEKHHMTATYSLGFGKWFSPYIGWRMAFMGGSMHWDSWKFSRAKYVVGNADIMWDMFNTFHGVNPERTFSIIPFAGIGGAFSWDFDAANENIVKDGNKIKKNQWTLPVSAGIQLRFRLSKYIDFFAEGRAQFAGDNFNNTAYGDPVDISLSAIGGFTFTIGGRDFKSYNPCDYTAYINDLNNQVNDLRGALAGTTAALAAAEAQLPCPEVVEAEAVVVEPAPLMSTVRFTINSAKISKMEKVNVYNIAQWMQANPDQNVAIVGYADKNTGSSNYNMGLSQRRAQAVADMLVKEYGIDAARLSVQAEGSSVQPYPENNWNRIVIFNVAK